MPENTSGVVEWEHLYATFFIENEMCGDPSQTRRWQSVILIAWFANNTLWDKACQPNLGASILMGNDAQGLPIYEFPYRAYNWLRSTVLP